MHLRHMLVALAVSVTWVGAAEAVPKAKAGDLDRVETAYAQDRSRSVERRPRYRRVVYRNWGPRRSVRVVRYARPVRYVRPAPVVRYGYPYGYYSPAYGYYRPVRYYAGYGWPYYRRPYFGGPYGGVSIGIGF